MKLNTLFALLVVNGIVWSLAWSAVTDPNTAANIRDIANLKSQLNTVKSFSDLSTSRGTARATKANDVVTFKGYSGVVISASGKTLFIKGTGALSGYAFSKYTTASGTVAATQPNDQVTLIGTGGVSVSASGKTITIGYGSGVCAAADGIDGGNATSLFTAIIDGGLSGSSFTAIITGGTASGIIRVCDNIPYYADASAGGITVDLAGLTNIVIIKADSTANLVTIIDSSGSTVQGVSSITLGVQYQFIRLNYFSGNWSGV